MQSIGQGKIFTGTSGIVLPVPNKLCYPPEFQDKSRLTYYASLFNSIEVNSSFYKVPMAATIKKWAESVPENFRFTFKLWREITHNKNLEFNPDSVFLFMERLASVGMKKGCLLVQFPPSVTSLSFRSLERLLETIHAANAEYKWQVALEFRNPSWYDDDLYQLIDNYRSTLVIHDISASATPMQEELSNEVYIRFHGPNGGYRGSYADDFLYEYAQYIKEWSDEGKTVYVYFNNTMGEAVNNLIRLNTYLAE
jgi:uncharacterized protein YecE (DUF72 family)